MTHIHILKQKFLFSSYRGFQTGICIGLFTLLLGFSSSHVSAQAYDQSLGLRLGWSNGITYKKFLSSETAFEGILYSRWRGLQITGLIEFHDKNTFAEHNLVWYYGFGGHVGFWEGKHSPWFHNNRTYTTLGVDGIIGIEYTFDEFPICLSLDYKPSFVIFGHSGFWGGDAALSARFYF
jgi:hypothetical protein